MDDPKTCAINATSRKNVKKEKNVLICNDFYYFGIENAIDIINILGIKDFDSDIFSYLAGIDWKNISLLDLSKTEKEFLDFAATVNVSTEQAKRYWNSYKQYMITTGAIDLAKSVNAPALADTIEQKLVDVLKEKDNITKAITSYLENGFLNFTESKELEEACKNLGLKVEDYLTKNSKGYSLDIFKL